MRTLRGALALLFVLAATVAFADDYTNLVDRAEFFLGKGSAYSPDAVRALEEAAQTDGQRAGSDPRFILAIGKAYLGVSRLSEAYQWLERFERSGVRDARVDALRDYLLKESGVGRFRLTSALPAAGVTGSFKVGAQGRLDAAAKKILEKLNAFLSVPFTVGREGVTLLVPEGQLVFSCAAPLGSEGVSERPVEIWAGEELEQSVIATFPQGDRWEVVPGNRAITLKWPQVEKSGGFKLSRSSGGKPSQVIYEGLDSTFTDLSAPQGEKLTYILRTFSPEGLLWGMSEVEATTMPPVGWVKAKGKFTSDLHVVLDWEMGQGSIDRLVIKKTERGEEKVILDQKGEEILRGGELLDGPLETRAGAQPLTYTVEALVNGVETPAASSVSVTIPAEVAKIESVKEVITQDRIYLEWETFPRDGIAEGYHVYLLREPMGMGEMVGTVKDAFAREFSYVPKSLDGKASWKHIVVPYSGNRLLVDPSPVEASDVVPEGDVSKRLKRLRRIPNMVLSWEPYRGTSRYLVRIAGKKEFLIRENYVELNGLQSNITDTNDDIKVFALTSDGTMVLILGANLQYKRYMGQEVIEEEKEK